MNYELFTKNIKNAEKIIIFSHVNPDGDTLGSMLALNTIIKDNFNKDSEMVSAGKIPDIYDFLPNINKIKKMEQIMEKGEKKYDLAIAIDIAAKDRMVSGLETFEKAKVKMNIDHHKTNNGYGDINFVDANACSAGEVLFDICEALKLTITQDAAIAIYTSILTDTGGFRFENTKASTLTKAARIIDLGANPSQIARYCYESKPKPMVMLQADSLINSKFTDNDKVAYVCLTNDDLKKFNAQNDHTEGIVEALRQINTTEVAFVLKEVDNQTTKVSLRSKNIDVSSVAGVFNGGGHTFAAGCTIRKPMKIAEEKILEEIRKLLGNCK